MSEAKTIGELLERTQAGMVKSHKAAVAEEPEADARTEGFALGVAYAASKFDEVLDYHIIPGADAVVTKEGLEAAANRIPEVTTSDCLCGRRYHHRRSFGERKAIARAAFEATGIVCVGLTLTANVNCGSITVAGSTGKLGRTPLLPGDTLYIKRANTSKHGPGIDKED